MNYYTELNKHFTLEEIHGDNYNDITVLLNCCNTLQELSECWKKLNAGRKFNKLNAFQVQLVTDYKDKLKKKFE